MPRPNKVWFRKEVGWWMVTLAGEKVRLAQGKANKKQAEQKLHELLAVRRQACAAYPFFSRVILHFGHVPGWSETTSG